MDTFLESIADFAPEAEERKVGQSNLQFDGLLSSPGLIMYEDGGATGCGGKLWPAGELLSKYLIRKGLKNHKRILELGSGTGLVGLAIGYNERDNDQIIYVTDQEQMIPLMQKNIDLNDLNKTVKAEILNWGEELPEFAKNIDLILAADCVYLESAFPLLEKTLLQLSNQGTPILMAYKKRRKADSRFFKAMKKNFIINEIKDHVDYPQYSRQSVFLFNIVRKATTN